MFGPHCNSFPLEEYNLVGIDGTRRRQQQEEEALQLWCAACGGKYNGEHSGCAARHRRR